MIKAKEKKERALGTHLHVKGVRCSSPKCALVRKPYRPGMHGKKRQKKGISDFGRQLREKQKFKVSYGLGERSLRRIFEEALRKPGSVALRLVELLEGRLDNVVFRLGLALSRSMARQLISHGHILVNQKRVRSAGFEVKIGDIISIREISLGKSAFQNAKDLLKSYEPPSWLHVDKEKLEGRVLAQPEDSAMPFEVNALVELFSK
jgi:small subunit ribosomal protein S4